jgi:hypothetical protein
VSAVGFLLNLSFPFEARHVAALRDVVAVAVKQAGGGEERARAFADQAAALVNATGGQQAAGGTLTVAVALGPPIQVRVGDQRLTLQNPADAEHHEPT